MSELVFFEKRDETNGWNSIEKITTCHKNVCYDVWAQSWNYKTNAFVYKRFCDLKYDPYIKDKMDQSGKWEDLPEGWFVTHWRYVPKSPIEEIKYFNKFYEEAQKLNKETIERLKKQAMQDAVRYINLNREDGGKTLNSLLKALDALPKDDGEVIDDAPRGWGAALD